MLNGLGKQEMIDDVNPYTLSVTEGRPYYDYLDKDQNFYYLRVASNKLSQVSDRTCVFSCTLENCISYNINNVNRS